MAVNRTKVLEAAQKFLSKGQYDKAVAEYQKLVHEDPRDVRTLLKIGDLHTRRNKPKDAIEVYQKVADLYAKQGFFLKAVAVYKQILKLDPGHLDATQKLAKMYEELALTSDALATYDLVADAYTAQGQVQKALEVMERMVELDGQNVAVRIKHAEGLSKAGKAREAAQAFAAGAKLLKDQGRMDDYLRVVERQLYHDPESVPVARELSRLYLERSDPKRALAKLQVCFKADPRDVQTLEMLAEAFRQLGQHAKTISVLKEIARLHGETGSDEPRRRALRRVLDLDPNDAEARQALASAAPGPAKSTAARPTAAPPRRPAPPQPPPPPTAVAKPVPAPAPAPLPRSKTRTEEIELEEAEAIELVEEEGESDDVLIVDEGPTPPTLEDRVLALLADADAREGAGDYEGAVAALQGVLELDPGHVAAHERLKDIYVAADRRVDAVKELLWLSSSWEGHNHDRAVHYAEQAYKLAPRSEATRRRLAALDVPIPGEGAKSKSAAKLLAAREADAELDAILPASTSGRPVPPEPLRGGTPRQAELLELPIDPGEFEAAPPLPRTPTLPVTTLVALLERGFTVDEFEAGPTHELGMGERPAWSDARREPARAVPVPRETPSLEFAPIGTSEIANLPALDGYDNPPSVGPAEVPTEVERPVSQRIQEASVARSGPPTLPPTLTETLPEPEPVTPPESRAAVPYEEPVADQTIRSEQLPEFLRSQDQPAPRAPSVPPARQAAAPTREAHPPSGAREVSPALEGTMPAEVEEALDEAEFFAAHGQLDEALEVIQEAILIYPASAALKQRLVEYEAKADQHDAERASEASHDDSFDIAEQLAGELVEPERAADGEEMIDVESVFAQFKKGVAEQIAPDDSETHFDLGIAYKEMGLIEDAVSEFELAAKSKKRACTALTMVGMCHVERGNPQLAITYFERALETEQHGPAEELALAYELGSAYEQVGALDKALTAFETVAARDRTFRGVAARLDQLKKRGVKSAGVTR